MKKIAIIPARSGSKGLKDKNILNLCGKPILAYSIQAAVESGMFESIIVSTDSREYGGIAKAYGVETMFRGEELSNDQATTYMVIKDVLDRISPGKDKYDYFVLLQPTSPMRTAAHVLEAAKYFEGHAEQFDFLVSVKEAEHAKILVNPIGEDGSLKYFDTDFSDYRRQGYTDYTPNGAIFIGKPDAYLKQKHFFGAKALAYKMSKIDSIDIDDQYDYEFACLCMAARMKGEYI